MQSNLVEDYWSVKLLILFIQAYKQKLVEHIEEEEKVLFSFVNHLIAGKKCENSAEFILDHFIQTHNDNIVIQLAELKKDLYTFDEELKDNLILGVLFNQLNIFQKDLMVHGLIEDHVFLQKIEIWVKQG
jgi:iron-sulfur cluster repair protein YtfE (RIC family)